MAIVTGDRYLEKLVKFVEEQAGPLIDGSLVLKLNPAGLHYVQLRLEALHELESLLAGAPIDYLRAYVSDLGDHRALEQLRRILRLLTSLKVVSVLPSPMRDPTPLSLLPFGRLKVLELRGCDLSTSAAKGLLELRLTLEKIICHNSTDALRHVFASRIAEIKNSPQWNRLSFVSCACNRLVLMDESLQLLPAVETLDLSRNKFAKVDNLRKCTKLKQLDLGFNQLRTAAPFSEVSCNIVKLVLRNNALTTLHGLENLKSLEELDVSYNIISNFSELELLAGLSSMCNLWLEGNPLCCARWYRAQVFSYFSHPDKLKLDNKEISTREFWKRRIIIASRQKQPASFGFYTPARDGAEEEGNINRKRRKVSRLAAIESEEESTYFSSDEESRSCDKEIQSKEENVMSDDEAEIVDLITRVELLKKERSIHWLREFKEWMDHEPENFMDGNTNNGPMLHHLRENHGKSKAGQKHHGRSSRYALDSFQPSGDGAISHDFESDNASSHMSTGSQGGIALPGMGRMNIRQNHQTSYSHEGFNSVSLQTRTSNPDAFAIQGGHRLVENGSISPLTTIDDTTESYSSSAYPGSPPHYQEDILHRRHNLVEEILQLSAESYSIASSDSITSSSEDDLHKFEHSVYEAYQSQNEGCLNMNTGEHLSANLFKDKNYVHGHGVHKLEKDSFLFNSTNNDFHAVPCDGEGAYFLNQDPNFPEKKRSKRKPRKRVISLSENMVDMIGTSEILNGNQDMGEGDVEDVQGNEFVNGSDFHEVIDKKQLRTGATTPPSTANDGGCYDDFIEKYFNANVADSKINETCWHYMRCDCILEPQSLYREREVALILSSEKKLYVLLIGVAFDGSGNILSLLGWHKVDDVREVLVGIGLQVVRVYIEWGATYLFLTRNMEKARELLYTLHVFGPSAISDKCSLRSVEQVQIQLFERQICGSSKISILQYSMVLFWHKNDKEESWQSRSLFISGGHVLLCVEDLKQFSSSMDASSPPYFSLDSFCSISDISELVLEARESRCIVTAVKDSRTKLCASSKTHKEVEKTGKESSSSGSLTWKLKWFSEESLLNFVALVKAIHSGVNTSPLLVTSAS